MSTIPNFIVICLEASEIKHTADKARPPPCVHSYSSYTNSRKLLQKLHKTQSAYKPYVPRTKSTNDYCPPKTHTHQKPISLQFLRVQINYMLLNINCKSCSFRNTNRRPWGWNIFLLETTESSHCFTFMPLG
jgi:hypothetical protein